MTERFLWEIGTEEIPARFMPDLIQQLTRLTGAALQNVGLEHGALRVLGTPRRLTVLTEDMAPMAADTVTEAKGPALKAAYDGEGQPTKALLGFCRGQGIDPTEIQQRELNGVPYVFAVKHNSGRPAIELLAELIPTVASQLSFAKPMRWGDNPTRFVRPIRWMVGLLGSQVLDASYAGVACDRFSRGHRFLGSDHIQLAEATEYEAKLAENYVIVDQAQRREMIAQQVQAAAVEAGGYLGADDGDLIDEVSWLVEYPTALIGHFEDKYLQLPQELVITPMKDQQRYFPVYDAAGKLLNRFITVRNGDDRHLEIVAEGNEKVLRARLSDAEFFYQEDIQENEDARVEKLSAVVFQEQLGTLKQKTDRIVALAAFIGQHLGYDEQELADTRRAAYLAKGDLNSHVVYEFPELQGIIGEYYALAAGEKQVVAQAIREHYLPRFAGDAVPESKPGIAVALADKLDSLSAFFAIGQIPSGSADPFALRRAAAGCVQIIVRHELALCAQKVLPFAFSLLEADVPTLEQEQLPQRQESIVGFLQQRLENLLAEEGVAYDEINAVSHMGAGDLLGALRRARALHQVRPEEHFHALLAGYHRAANILRSAAEKTGAPLSALPQVQPSLFREDSEGQLYQAVCAAENTVRSLSGSGDYAAALAALSQLSDPINQFFESVMVMDEDVSVRQNRLAMLAHIVAMADDIADLREIVE